MTKSDGREEFNVNPIVGNMDDVRGFDASTYTGMMLFQIKSPQKEKGYLLIVKRITKIMKALMSQKGIKVSLFERDGGSGKITKAEEFPGTHEGIDK